MRNRLIELLKKKYDHFCDQCGVNKDSHYTENLADYLLANGVIVPPCKVGDKIYCDGEHFASHCKGKVMEFAVNDIETNVKSMFRGEVDVQFDFEAFGKTVFLTREEAEAKLKEGAE